MGYLDNTSTTVDAILTKKGRELLAQGTNAFNITKFALADDEVDYRLDSTSSSIDAGDPGSAYDDADGSVNDQGAYGGEYGDW